MKWLENRMQGDEIVKIISGNNKKVKYTNSLFHEKLNYRNRREIKGTVQRDEFS